MLQTLVYSYSETCVNLTLSNPKTGVNHVIRAFNIFQVYQYFSIYRWYFLSKFEKIYDYIIQHSLKLGGTKDHFRWV